MMNTREASGPGGKSAGKNTRRSTFSSNIEKFSAVGLEFFNITFEFIEKNLNTRVLQHGNNNS